MWGEIHVCLLFLHNSQHKSRNDIIMHIFCVKDKKLISHVNSSSKLLPLNFFWSFMIRSVFWWNSRNNINVFLIKDYIQVHFLHISHACDSRLLKFLFSRLFFLQLLALTSSSRDEHETRQLQWFDSCMNRVRDVLFPGFLTSRSFFTVFFYPLRFPHKILGQQ